MRVRVPPLPPGADAAFGGKRNRRLALDRDILESLYRRYNRREYVSPDPLEFLYRYPDARDREIAGLVASALAYGRVAQILKSVGRMLEPMGASPFDFVTGRSPQSLRDAFPDFKHRFTTGAEMGALLAAIRSVLREYGSIGACFRSFLDDGHESVIPAASAFTREMTRRMGVAGSYLLPSPVDGSACKRLNLYLRWMIRRDAVDPGGWEAPAAKLIVPLDAHIWRLARALRLTDRKQPNLRAAIEITEAFRSVSPDDPVRYDFALTRAGLRPEMKDDAFIRLLESEPPAPSSQESSQEI